MIYVAVAQTVLVGVLAAVIWAIERSNALERADRARAHDVMVQTLLERIQRPERPLAGFSGPTVDSPPPELDESGLVGTIADLKED